MIKNHLGLMNPCLESMFLCHYGTRKHQIHGFMVQFVQIENMKYLIVCRYIVLKLCEIKSNHFTFHAKHKETLRNMSHISLVGCSLSCLLQRLWSLLDVGCDEKPDCFMQQQNKTKQNKTKHCTVKQRKPPGEPASLHRLLTKGMGWYEVK